MKEGKFLRELKDSEDNCGLQGSFSIVFSIFISLPLKKGLGRRDSAYFCAHGRAEGSAISATAGVAMLLRELEVSKGCRVEVFERPSNRAWFHTNQRS